ncbi:MAG: nucleoside recognition domain-containing protein [Moorellales bacterium]
MTAVQRLWAGIAWIAFTALLVCYPHASFAATSRALSLWWQVVLPGLLPFLVASALLNRLGITYLAGRWLEPVTRRLFNLPGAAALVIVLGYSSGPPVAATMVAELRRRHLCTRHEAEKLLGFAHNASPLFLLAAVPVGMLGNAALGWPLAAAHYGANLILGLCWRWYGCGDRAAPGRERLLAGAADLLSGYEIAPATGLPGLTADAFLQAFRTLLLVAGYMTISAVGLALLEEAGILLLLEETLFRPLLSWLSLSPDLGEALATGMVEMTLGAHHASQVSAPLIDRLSVISLILGWSGLSVYGQVASVLTGTDIRLTPYLLSRLAQGLLASGLVRLWVPAVVPTSGFSAPATATTWPPRWAFGASLLLLGVGLATYFLLALLCQRLRQT